MYISLFSSLFFSVLTQIYPRGLKLTLSVFIRNHSNSQYNSKQYNSPFFRMTPTRSAMRLCILELCTVLLEIWETQVWTRTLTSPTHTEYLQ